MKDNLITITKGEYKRLLRIEAKLDALEAFGVDNWGGYGDALSSLEEDNDE